MNEVFLYNDKEPVVKTFDIFKKLGYNEHRFLKEVITKNLEDFQDFGLLRLETLKPKKGSKGGRPEKSYMLNEDQFILLITLCKNTKEVVYFKKAITKQFTKMRKHLIQIASQKQNQEWLTKRQQGKYIRRESTDAIKEFVDYATSQGSKSANMYYMRITKMENDALFFLSQKYKNLRDLLNYEQLNTIETADKIVSRALKEGIEKDMLYKDIYKLARDRVVALVDLIGRSKIGELTYQEKLQLT